MSAGGNDEYWFVALKPKDLRNRDRFRTDAVLIDETRTFRTEKGETVSYRVMKEVASEPLPTLTRDEFVKRLKTGETWTLIDFAEQKCRA